MQHPDEGTIHAWLDGEVAADEARDLESHVAECEECSARVAEARGLIAASSRIVSGLDFVPGGVIPTTEPRKRAWYSSVQFRAAAGILIVAGASLILLNKSEQHEPRAAMELPKTQPAAEPAPATQAPRPVIALGGSATASTPVQTRAQNSAISREKKSAESQQAKALEERKATDAVSDAAGATQLASPVAAAAAAVAAVPAPAPAAKRIVSDTTMRLSEVVVTGVATAVESPLKLVSSDTSQAAVRNVYEVQKGVEVTLVETTLSQKSFVATAERRERAPRPLTAAPAIPPANANEAATNSITWSKGDKVFTLTGAMSRIQLEAIRLKLPEEKR